MRTSASCYNDTVGSFLAASQASEGEVSRGEGGGTHVLHRNTGVVNRNQGSAVGTSPHPCDCWGVVTVETVDLWAAEVTLSIISIIILFWLSNTQVKLKNCFQEMWFTDSTNLLEPEVGSKRGLMDILILLF